MNSTNAQTGQSTLSVSSCDAWANIIIGNGSAPYVINDSFGVSAAYRENTSVFGISFSNPVRFGSGSFITLVTPEIYTDSDDYFAFNQYLDRGDVGATATGLSGGVRFSTWRWNGPLGAGGNTAECIDLPTESVGANIAAICLVSDNSTYTVSNGTSFEFRLMDQGNTYTSHFTNVRNKAEAVAYGTLVVPGSYSTSGYTVSAYIENGFNVAGVSCGSGMVFDITMKQPLVNNSYCVILSAENDVPVLQSSGAETSVPAEYSHLQIRAGAEKKYKTNSAFRVEIRKQDTTNNKWSTTTPVRANQGLTEKVHFIVFGENTRGNSYLTNPQQNRLSTPINATDFTVWAASWIDPDYGAGKNRGTATTSTSWDTTFASPLESKTAAQAGYKSVVPLIITYESGAGSLGNMDLPWLGRTLSSPNLINRAIDSFSSIPASRRAWYPRNLSPLPDRMNDGGNPGWESHQYLPRRETQYWAQTTDGVSYGTGWSGYGLTAANTTAVAGVSLSERIILSSDDAMTTKYWDTGYYSTAYGYTAYRNVLGGFTGTNALTVQTEFKVGHTGITLTALSTSGYTLEYKDTIVGYTMVNGNLTTYKYYVGLSGATANANESKFVPITAASGWTWGAGSTLEVYKRVVIPGATLVSGRKMLSPFADNHTAAQRLILADFLDKMSAGVITDRSQTKPSPVSYIFDDHEDYDYSNLYYLGGSKGLPRGIVAWGSGYTGSGTVLDPVNGVSMSWLYDDLGVSAGYTLWVNAADPDVLRAWASDPRMTTYKYDYSGVTTDNSLTFEQRFLKAYNDLVTNYGKGKAPSGATPASLLEAVEWAYLSGRNVSSGVSYARLPSNLTEYLPNTYVGGGGRGKENVAKYYLEAAWTHAYRSLTEGHYRSLLYREAQSRGVSTGNYTSYPISNVEDALYAPGANLELYIGATLSSNRLVQQAFYGSVGSYDAGPVANSNLGNIACYFPNPTTNVERYYFCGSTSPAADLTYDYNAPSNSTRFYHRTALSGKAAYNGVGETLSPALGLSAAASYSATDTGITAWKGFTYCSGDILYIGGRGITIASYITAGNAGSGGKVRVNLFGPIGTNGVEGDTFHVQRAYNNPGFLAFVYELRKIRNLQRSMPDLYRRFIPWITSPHWTKYGYWKDRRYWWEICYHLYLAGARNFVVWQDSGDAKINYTDTGRNEAPTTRSRNDGDMITIDRMLQNIRNTSGNSTVSSPKITTINPLNDTVFVSGARIESGDLSGMYLWRITVRPGPPNERISLIQTDRSDIPKQIIITDAVTAESPHGNRGTWLITKSAEIPNYQIG